MAKIYFAFLLLLIASYTYSQDDYETERQNMVSEQLISRGITDKHTLKAMAKVPRHLFVPQNMREMAYSDRPLPIGEGQTISQPFIVAFMTQALELKPAQRVLEVGTGSGYQAAILGEIVEKVFTIEIIEPLGLRAKEQLKNGGHNQVRVKIGDGYHGWPEESPFDAIMVTAGAESIPPALIEQLKDGGRMIIPVGPSNAVRQLVLLTKRKGKIKKKEIMPVRFVPFTRTNKN